MKNAIAILVLLTALTSSLKSQNEKFGNSLNVGIGAAYAGFGPAVNVNYEFDVFRNFTLAPFISAMTYRDYNYWGSPNHPYKNYYYRETSVPVGVKASYYFDEWLKAGERWDFYVGTSIGVAYRATTWESGYDGNRRVERRYESPLYGSMHIGSECHLTERVGIYLDLSTGLSTFGLGFHF
ncbi:hypothetical protein CNR22_14120 [Sphingobacteriaceae bacterium]|nr:hypothetical protein CNR22_14120 [Sphingobacteriaceae bacterium]